MTGRGVKEERDLKGTIVTNSLKIGNGSESRSELYVEPAVGSGMKEKDDGRWCSFDVIGIRTTSIHQTGVVNAYDVIAQGVQGSETLQM